ncbi:hypothetical protein CSB69_2041 [Morganella morganii]|uniref:hypothetical protein n=1 Tax=Morganella morganii TaxID=582 RepID=UPI000D204284|nr:hypothetical protein [Morganella morganii]AVK37119.1 hypothetical protein CSB69_2041 [Morganella morganii]
MEFKTAFSWRSDDMPETTDAVVYVSRCGTVVKTGSYKHWNKKIRTTQRVKSGFTGNQQIAAKMQNLKAVRMENINMFGFAIAGIRFIVW